MSIGLVAAGTMAATAGQTFEITYGSDDTFNGYSDGTETDTSFGSISPTTFDGNTIIMVVFDPELERLHLFLSGEYTTHPFERFSSEAGSFLAVDAATQVAGDGSWTRWTWFDSAGLPSSGSATFVITV